MHPSAPVVLLCALTQYHKKKLSSRPGLRCLWEGRQSAAWRGSCTIRSSPASRSGWIASSDVQPTSIFLSESEYRFQKTRNSKIEKRAERLGISEQTNISCFRQKKTFINWKSWRWSGNLHVFKNEGQSCLQVLRPGPTADPGALELVENGVVLVKLVGKLTCTRVTSTIKS